LLKIAANAIFVICCSHLLAFGTFIRVRSLQITSQLSKVRANSHTDKQIDVLLDLQNSSGHKTPLADQREWNCWPWARSDMAASENEFYFYMQESERGERKAF
jgi:hypothetical protein